MNQPRARGNPPAARTDRQDADDQPLDASDMSRIVGLLGRVADLNEPLNAKRHALTEGLCELVGADCWFWVFSAYDRDAVYNLQAFHGRIDESGLVAFHETTNDPEIEPPEMRPLVDQLRHGRPITRRRQQLFSDEQWYAFKHVKMIRKGMIKLDHFVFSLRPIGEGIFSALGLHRRWGREPFTPREARIVHIMMSEVPWAHAVDGLDDTVRESLPELAPRLRTVLGLLVQGWSRARIAERLGLTELTVRGYISEVYRHFGVRSHQQLMRRLSIGDGGDRSLPAS